MYFVFMQFKKRPANYLFVVLFYVILWISPNTLFATAAERQNNSKVNLKIKKIF